MFDNLTSKFSSIFSKLTSKGILTEDDVTSALREIRLALLEADVSLQVVKDLMENIKAQAVGEKVLSSIKPGQLVVKIVQDELTKLLTFEKKELAVSKKQSVIMVVGLQGSGKTTTAAKLAYKLKENKNILLSSLDVYRPAAQEQLKVLAEKVNVNSTEIITKEKPLEIARRTLQQAKDQESDVVILDTAGRLHIDDELMAELLQIKKLAQPSEILLVADAMTGQDAVNIASEFHEKIGLTGIILTRMDGDSRGGAALSMSHITKCPVKFVGTGEKYTDLEDFHPDRVATRILGKGDIVSLVEKATQAVEEDEAEKLAKRMQAGLFNYNDMFKQLRAIKKMGSIGSLMGMIPGLSNMKKNIDDAGADKQFTKNMVIIQSMTKKERKFPQLLNTSRKNRIVKGSGVTIQDVNVLMKQFKKMEKMVKQLKKMGQKGMLQQYMK